MPVASPVVPDALVRVALRLGVRDAPARLEQHLREAFSATGVHLYASGTQALQAAMEIAWNRSGRRGPVALPAYACYDLATAAIGAGLPVTFFDVDPATLSPDTASLEEVLHRGASVVVVAPLYGIPVDYAAVADLCSRFGAIAVEDAAQGQGAVWRDRPLGAHGDISVLSFGRGKGWTGGGGGALLTRGAMADAMPGHARRGTRAPDELRVVVALAAQWAIGRPSLYGIASATPGLHLGETVYHPPAIPARMPAAAAALALAHADPAARRAAERRASAATWEARLAELPGIDRISLPVGAEGGYLRYPLLAARPLDATTAPAAARLGVARGYPRPLPELPELQPCIRYVPDRLDGAERLARSLVTLPTHWQVTAEDRGQVLDLVATHLSESAV